MKQKKDLTLDYWRASVDKMLTSNEQPLLEGPGSVSHDDMKRVVHDRHRNAGDAPMLERLGNRRRCVARVLVEMLAPYIGRVCDPCCGSAGMFAFQVGIHDAAPREEFLEVSVPWNRTSAVASQSLGKSSPIIAMTTPERQLEEQLIQA